MAVSVEEFVQELLAFDPNVEDDFLLDKQLWHVRKLMERANPALLLNTSLELFDPSTHTLSYLLILDAHIRNTKSAGKATDKLPKPLLPHGSLWPHITNLLLNFDPRQVRYAGPAFMNLYQGLATAAEQTDDIAPAIQILHHIILRLDPASSTLTPAHFSFIRLCLGSRAFHEAADILNRPIVSLPFDGDKPTIARSYKYLCSVHDSSATYLTPSTGLNTKWSYRRYLEYFIMGGMVFMALRHFTKAQFYFEVILAAPITNPSSVSMIQVEAYKKWVLINLLIKGRSCPPPRAIHGSTLKAIRALAKPYDCLVEAFKSNNLSTLRAEIDAATRFWQGDSNMGLVIEVFHAFRKFQVQKLAETFAALPIAEVAQRTSPDPNDLAETTAYITSLIAAGELHAVMAPSNTSTSQPTLRFLPSASNKTEAQIRASLGYQSGELVTLLRAISNNDHRLEISKEYIELLKKMRKVKEQQLGSAGADPASGNPGLTFDAGFEDEDMMADE